MNEINNEKNYIRTILILIMGKEKEGIKKIVLWKR
jgi:hypothetical protein